MGKNENYDSERLIKRDEFTYAENNKNRNFPIEIEKFDKFFKLFHLDKILFISH